MALAINTPNFRNFLMTICTAAQSSVQDELDVVSGNMMQALHL
jgi:hypothetical protein